MILGGLDRLDLETCKELATDIKEIMNWWCIYELNLVSWGLLVWSQWHH